MRSFFRYPGGKHKLITHLLGHIEYKLIGREYREPFFGGGSVGINVIDKFKPSKIWINDFDVPLADLWTMVINQPDVLKDTAKAYQPTVDDFFRFKELLTGDLSELSPDERGFMKLAIHQMSYSGLGTMAGGPIGGKSQTSNYPVDCRWSPKNICKQVDRIHALFSTTEIRYGCCTALDYIDLITKPGEAFIYLDPPYYDQGETLYQYGFDIQQHVNMRDALKECQNPWVLSYDDCPEILNLYSGWSNVYRIDGVNYSIKSIQDEHGNTSSSKKSELLIVNA